MSSTLAVTMPTVSGAVAGSGSNISGHPLRPPVAGAFPEPAACLAFADGNLDERRDRLQLHLWAGVMQGAPRLGDAPPLGGLVGIVEIELTVAGDMLDGGGQRGGHEPAGGRA